MSCNSSADRADCDAATGVSDTSRIEGCGYCARDAQAKPAPSAATRAARGQRRIEWEWSGMGAPCSLLANEPTLPPGSGRTFSGITPFQDRRGSCNKVQFKSYNRQPVTWLPPHAAALPSAARWRKCYLWRKLGGRFSTKAAMPSFWSSVENSEWNTRRSNSRPSLREDSKARLTHSLAIMTEGSDMEAMTVAASSASSSSLSAGTTRDT